MTDKQIIIDGVDVSGCNRLNTFPMQYGEPYEICLTSLEQWGGQEKYCKDRPNCYYKQLKAKEQECEELAYENYELNELFDRLKAENDELKIEIKQQRQNVADSDVFATFCYDEEQRLKQTLTEIKEIAERGFKHSQCNCGAKADLDLILQKISEVKNG